MSQWFANSAPDSLCIVRLSAIGDSCHALAVVRNLQDNWPQTSITWIVGKTEASLHAGLDGVEFIRSYASIAKEDPETGSVTVPENTWITLKPMLSPQRLLQVTGWLGEVDRLTVRFIEPPW